MTPPKTKKEAARVETAPASANSPADYRASDLANQVRRLFREKQLYARTVCFLNWKREAGMMLSEFWRTGERKFLNVFCEQLVAMRHRWTTWRISL
jgi:hypothetical protein